MRTLPSIPYIEALRAWNKSAAEWLGLDPAQVFEFDAERDKRIDLYPTGADVVAFEAAVGPKPEQFTPEQRAQLALLAQSPK